MNQPQTPNNEVAPTHTTMNPQEINRRIAIACGWLDIKEQADDCGTTGLCGVPARHANAVGLGSAFDYTIPNYYGDLNAMHEAENTLKDEQKFPYMEEIYNLTDSPDALECGWYLTNATAAQRAEAFLRTIGQWEEGK